MSITIYTRAGKGLPLNANEHDASLLNLKAAIEALKPGGGGTAANAETLNGYGSSLLPEPLTVPVAGENGKLDAGWMPEHDHPMVGGFENRPDALWSPYMTVSGEHGLMQIVDALGDLVFEVDAKTRSIFLKDVVRHSDIDFEFMRVNFQSITWAQFAIYDRFQDESWRDPADPSSEKARVYNGRLDTGSNSIPGLSFGFVGKTFSKVTTLETGTNPAPTPGGLTDGTKVWFPDEYKGVRIRDSLGALHDVTGNDAHTLFTATAPAAGPYEIVEKNPSYCVGFLARSDATNGGHGHVKLEASFNGGLSYVTLYDSLHGLSLLEGAVRIVNSGEDYKARLHLMNDDQGRGPLVYGYFIVTDPTPWRDDT